MRRSRAWGVAAAGILCAVVQFHAPACAQGTGPDSVALVWTSPGDDGAVGTATAYELRVATSPIDESNWGSAALVTGLPAPLPAGTVQRTVVRALDRRTTYYFAIRSVDDAGNWSGLSNVARWGGSVDPVAPAAPTGLSAVVLPDHVIRLGWQPNGETDLAGYTVYRAIVSGGTFLRLNSALVSGTEYVDDTVPAGTGEVWYQVTASDRTGNEGARSEAIHVGLLTTEATAWALEPGYPNPSGAGAVVRIPLVVPTGGGSARVEIINKSGQRVRVLDLGTLPAGMREVQWDGRNDGGREVAPGVYVAWLTAGSARHSVRLVRVP